MAAMEEYPWNQIWAHRNHLNATNLERKNGKMKNNHRTLLTALALCSISLLLLMTTAFAQDRMYVGPPPPHDGPAVFGATTFGPPPPEFGFMAEPGFGPGEPWNNPHIAEKLGLTPDQQKKLDELSLQHRLKAIDLRAALEKEETLLHSYIAADQPDESKILAQIDKTTQGRAELEKEQTRMMLAVRKILSQEQWKKLHSEEHGEHRIMIRKFDHDHEGEDHGPDSPHP